MKQSKIKMVKYLQSVVQDKYVVHRQFLNFLGLTFPKKIRNNYFSAIYSLLYYFSDIKFEC